MTVTDMMKKRSEAFEAAKNFAAAHADEKGLLSDEDYGKYTEMEKEIENYTREITRMQREADTERMLENSVNTPILTRPQKAGTDSEKGFRASAEYKNAMLAAFRSNFRNVSNVLQEGVAADGGYLVPDEYDRRLIDVLDEENVMRKLATTITTSGEHKINIAGTKPAAAWVDEGDPLSFATATFAQKNLDAFKLQVAIKVTEELLYDNAFNLENYIMTQFGKALANAEEDAFLNGNGTGKPTGIFNATNGGTITTSTAAKVTTDALLELVYSLKRPYRKNAKFIMNDSTLLDLRKLKDLNGAYIWQPSYQAGEPDRVLGYEVYTSAYAPTGAIAFGDYSYYNIGDRGTRSFKKLEELFAGDGMIGFVAKERVDGKLVLPEAVQVLQFTTTTPTP